MNRTNKSYQVLLIGLATLLAAPACTMFKTNQSDKLDTSNATVQVVQHRGTRRAIYSARKHNAWVDLANSQKSSQVRLHATLAAGDTQLAQDRARERLTKRPDDKDGLTVLAAALALDGQYDLAAYYARRLRALHGASATALNIEALSIMLKPKPKMADYDEARARFQQAFEAESDQVAAGLNLGHLQLELGDAASASSTFEEAAKRCNGCNAARMGAGIAAARVGQHDRARDHFEAVLDRDRKHGPAMYHLALVYKNGLKKRDKAEDILEDLLVEVRPKDVYLRERADTVLRDLRTEAPEQERLELANTEADSRGSGDADDAAELMKAADDLDTDLAE